jgi:hypothetical protein
MTKCLKDMLTLLSHDPGPTYILLDALNECPNISGITSPREEILNLVKELVGLRLPNLRICVTSQPDVDIQAVLQPLALHHLSIHDESGQKQAIADYVSYVVHSDKRMQRWREEDRDLVIKTLSEKANGMYVHGHMMISHSYDISQVSVGVLSSGAFTAISPTKCAESP